VCVPGACRQLGLALCLAHGLSPAQLGSSRPCQKRTGSSDPSELTGPWRRRRPALAPRLRLPDFTRSSED
jgi:hypothetical protein